MAFRFPTFFFMRFSPLAKTARKDHQCIQLLCHTRPYALWIPSCRKVHDWLPAGGGRGFCPVAFSKLLASVGKIKQNSIKQGCRWTSRTRTWAIRFAGAAGSCLNRREREQLVFFFSEATQGEQPWLSLSLSPERDWLSKRVRYTLLSTASRG